MKSYPYSMKNSIKKVFVCALATVLAFVVERSYDSYIHHEKIRWQDIQWPLAFAAVLIGMLLFFFSGLGSASQL